MAQRKRRYWAIRTDRNNRGILLDELRAGRLRQGWGYDAIQDLRLIQGEISRGGSWWDRLSATQKEVLPHLRMLADVADSVQHGDWVVVPNMPEDGLFVIAEVIGDYGYAPVRLLSKDDVNDLGEDYGHILPVRILTANGINRHADEVAADLRGSLRTPMRMWSLDSYAEALERLVHQSNIGADLSQPTPGRARLERAWSAAQDHAVEELRKRLDAELGSRFQAAEWEEPIKIALEGLYPGSAVRWVAGPREMGADVVVQIRNPFRGAPWLIVVQVKNYVGRIGAAVVDQLRTAHEHYSKEGTVVALVVMTTAEQVGDDLRIASTALSDQLKLPVDIVLRKEMMKILSDGLMLGMARPRAAELEASEPNGFRGA